jgi:hypothetical protein
VRILTAHDLLSGEVVYWSADGRWAESLSEAARLDDAAASAALAEAEAAYTAVVHAYLVPTDSAGAPVAREKIRETIRAKGPSTDRSLGKQAAAKAVSPSPREVSQ